VDCTMSISKDHYLMPYLHEAPEILPHIKTHTNEQLCRFINFRAISF